MSYQSIDTLQNTLKDTVFSHTKDAKKAAGRALGTMVELVTYYLLREWGLCDYISIERGLPEFGDKEILHNVEFTLHPIQKLVNVTNIQEAPITSTKIIKTLDETMQNAFEQKKSNKLVDSAGVLRNSCLLAETDKQLLVANLHADGIHVALQQNAPFAMVECKRVGVEEGCKKGPQTIEKAKQGAYVAQMTSSLQKIWVNGQRYGLIYKNGGSIIKPYNQLLEEVIADEMPIRDFILSIGVVSNHGNWFTAENKNKEMKVLANSYDWLLFLTDAGLAEFVTSLLLDPQPQDQAVRDAFINSYKEGKKANVFTKTKIDKAAHNSLCRFFSENISRIEEWFNVIAPENHDISYLKSALVGLAHKKVGGNAMTAGRHVNTLSQSWGTPPKYVNAIKQFWNGHIGLDPCSNEYSVVHADKEYLLPKNDGLKEEWNSKTIYVNPPYGSDRERGTTIKDWLAKCVNSHKKYGADVIALVPVAPNTGHWKKYVFGQANAICFLYDTRLRFLENGKDVGKGAPMACCLIYWGTDKERFMEHFLEYGATVDISYLHYKKIGIDRKEQTLEFVPC